MREGSSESRERRQAEAGIHMPGPGGGGGRAGEEAHQAAAEARKSWTGQRQKRKSTEYREERTTVAAHELMTPPHNKLKVSRSVATQTCVRVAFEPQKLVRGGVRDIAD